MAKSFRDLVRAINEVNIAPTEGKVGGKPKAKGEAEFAAAHGYPVTVKNEKDEEYPTKNADDVLNARDMKQTDAHKPGLPGERTVVQQGNSKMKDFSGFQNNQTKPNRGDKRQGDTKNLRLSSSAVEPISEAVMGQLNSIANSGKSGVVRFDDGDTAKVDSKTADKVVKFVTTHKNSVGNLGKSAKKFLEIMNKI